ncbi:MAG: hypothetical protein ACD_60C00149G0025 [uncultured bacterium]|nr:MAG: hypothetical protein ACD_60C00149G0025 [uncultured bacterium]
MLTEKNTTQQMIDDCFKKEMAIEEEYFKRTEGMPHWLKKPFSGIEESASYCIQLGRLIGGLHLARGMTVLDWGAGSCWLSEIMNKLGMKTISLDSSQSALDVGKYLFSLDKRIDMSLNPEFVYYDGKTIPLPDHSVDRIVISWAFHHIINKIGMLKEFYRILRQDGIIGFMDAGVEYDKSPQALHERETFGALEDNLNIEELRAISKELGFSKLLRSLSPHPEMVFEFENYAECPKDVIFDSALEFAKTHELFFIVKGNPYQKTTLFPGNTVADFVMKDIERKGDHVNATISVKNIGDTTWLAKTEQYSGTVFIGCHLYDQNRNLVALDYSREALDKDCHPDHMVAKTFSVKLPDGFSGFIEFDLVNEGYFWFKQKGTKTVMKEV